MLGADGRQPPHPHAVMRARWNRRSEITAAIDGDFVPQAGQFVASLLVIGLDATVLGDHAAAPDERDADPAARASALRRSGDGNKLSGGCEPVVEFEQLLHVPIRVMVCLYATASCGTHLLDQVGAVKQKFDGLSKLFAVAVGIKEAGEAMLDEFAARTQIGGDDGPPQA